jgi:hypothetical protein
MMTKTYKNHWSRGVTSITVLTAVLLVGIGVFLAVMFARPEVPDALMAAFMAGYAAFVVGMFGWMACLAPRSLTVDDNGVVLRRVAGRLEIPADEIVEMREVAPEELRGMIRIAGSGGFCGYIGRFWNRRLGHFVLNITEQRNLLMVRTAKKKYIFNYL